MTASGARRCCSNTDQPFDRPWDIRTIVHGHDGYLDIALVMGIPALCVAVFTFLIEPLRDYLRIPLLKENIFLGDFFMMVRAVHRAQRLPGKLLLPARRPGLAVLRVRRARPAAGRPLPDPLASPRRIAASSNAEPNRLCRALLEDRHVRDGCSRRLRQYGLRHAFGLAEIRQAARRRKSSSSSPTPSCASAPQSSAQRRRPSAADLPADIAPTLVDLRREAAGDARRGRRPIAASPAAARPSSASPPAPASPRSRNCSGDRRADRALHAQHAGGDRQGHDGGGLQSQRRRQSQGVSSPICCRQAARWRPSTTKA